VKGRSSGTEITVGSFNVSKRYTTRDCHHRVIRSENIYHWLKQKNVPNVDRLVASYNGHPEHGSSIYLQPKGLELQPQLVSEIIEAVVCVLQALLVRLIIGAAGVLNDIFFGKVMHAVPALYH
jgi:hypothetical protein